MWEVPEEVKKFVRRRINPEGCRNYIHELAEELLSVDTTPKEDPRLAREAEARVFGIIQKEATADRVEFSFEPLDPRMSEHPYYTPPYYAPGLPPERIYEGRGNLLARFRGVGQGPTLALNGHIDTVAPYVPFRREGDVFYGRGTADDMGNVLAMVLSIRLLGELEAELGLVPKGELLYMFVIEEETGGNGSLSLALDPEVAYDAILVHEVTDFRVHPANRGAVWYKVDMVRSDGEINLVELASHIVLALEEEGRRIRKESDHPLFPSRPVQTCQGILGPFGSHPSAVNDRVVLAFEFPDGRKDALRAALEEGLRKYLEKYGRKVERHYVWEELPGGARITVLGRSGHMGAIEELDDAITKAAYMVVEAMGTGAEVRLDAEGYDVELSLEGGQGFLPTHSLEEVTHRMSSAVLRGAREYLERKGVDAEPGRFVRVSYDKLHNEAYDGDPEGPLVKAGISALKLAGLWKGGPVTGWEASCDARLFAKLRPGHEAVCLGCGDLSRAHSHEEHITAKEVASAAEVIVYTVLGYCGAEEV